MNRNKLMTAVMAGTMMIGSALPVSAAEPDQTVTQTETDAARQESTDVLYTQASDYSVTIPKTIVLD